MCLSLNILVRTPWIHLGECPYGARIGPMYMPIWSHVSDHRARPYGARLGPILSFETRVDRTN